VWLPISMRDQLERFHQIEYAGLEDFIRKTRPSRPSQASVLSQDRSQTDILQRKFTKKLLSRVLKAERTEGLLRKETGISTLL
jgi:hypothetical protein